MLWLHEPSQITGRHVGRYTHAAMLKIGWRIVALTPAGRALLEAHG